MVGNGAAIRQNFSEKVALVLTSLFVFLILALTPGIHPKTGSVSVADASGGSGYAVIEVSSGRLLNGSNENLRLPMASTTKAMTALVVLENASLSDIVEIPPAAVGIEGS